MDSAGHADASRGGFGSRLGFIFAAAGSAIGLGNIWRFPYAAGENGGGAFVLVYLCFVVVIGIPVLLSELAVGRASGTNTVGAFSRLAPRSRWSVVGALGVVTGFGILAFYSVVAGWSLSYLGRAASGLFTDPFAQGESRALFGRIVADPVETVAMTAAFLGMTAIVVRAGVGQGIERSSKILMPIFFLVLAALAVRSMTLPGARQGLEFLFAPDFSKLTAKSVLSALGQALFSLSLGMGAMITYGSYLKRGENLVVAGISVAAFDTLIALLGGLIIFPALFSAGVAPDSGPKLVFVVLPTIFHTLPAGGVFAVAFYGLLCVAALTSMMSLLEVVVAYFVDERRWSRERAVWLVSLACLVLAVPSALSQGAVAGLGDVVAGKDFLTLQSILFGSFSLSIGALLICVFVGWVWGMPAMLRETAEMPGAAIFSILVRFVCPAAIASTLGFIVYALVVWGAEPF